MKRLLALLSLSLLASCSTKPWMVGSYNDVGCPFSRSKMGKYPVPADIQSEPEAAPYSSGKSAKDSRSVLP
jgi:hypothetical protein